MGQRLRGHHFSQATPEYMYGVHTVKKILTSIYMNIRSIRIKGCFEDRKKTEAKRVKNEALLNESEGVTGKGVAGVVKTERK